MKTEPTPPTPWQAHASRMQAALQAEPDNIGLHGQWARELRQAGQHPQAIDVLRGVLQKQPQQGDALLELGGLLMLQGRMALAQKCYQRILRHHSANPALYPLALFNLAQCFEAQGLTQKALAAYQAVLQHNPADTRALYHHAFLQLALCDWQHYDQRMAELQTRLSAYLLQTDAPPLAPLRLLSFAAPPALHKRLAQHWAGSIRRAVQPLALPPQALQPVARSQPAAIRIGYLSADFRQHAMGSLVHGLFAHHQRPQFEVFAYSLSDVADDHTASVQSGVDHFCPVHNHTSLAIAQRIRADGIDVLIDLMGYTHLSRPEVLALRAAPVQLHYLGYPGPLAADFYDGVIADAALIPPHLEADYGMPVHRLPCAFVWSPAPQASQQALPKAPTRADHGLPGQGVVYASFNRTHKLDPHTFALWLGVLAQVPGSVLWLVQGDQRLQDQHDQHLIRQRLCAQAQAAGVDAARLVFSAPVAPADFAGLCALADLLLDTAHYGAGATGVAALHAGLPLLTCPGNTFAARMGASLCAATGLQALVCASPSDYAAKAVALGLAPARLASLRSQLLAQRDNLPLFQTAAWVRSLEALLVGLVQRH